MVGKRGEFLVFFLLLGLNFNPVWCYGQVSLLDNAKAAFKNGELKRAANFIDRAERSPQTFRMPQTWYYSYLIQIGQGLSDPANDKSFFEKANVAALKCIELDTAMLYTNNLQSVSDSSINILEKRTAELKNKNQYKEAFGSFVKTFYLLNHSSYQKGIYFKRGAELALGAKAFEKSATLYDSAIAVDYQVKDCLLGKIEAWDLAGEKSRAFTVVKDAYQRYPSSQVFLVPYIESLIERKLIFSANDLITNARKKNPDNEELIYLQGYINLGLDNDISIKAFKEALQLAPQHFNSNFELGKILLEEGKLLNNPEKFKNAQYYLENIKEEGEDRDDYLKIMEDLYLHIQDFTKYQRIRNLRNQKD